MDASYVKVRSDGSRRRKSNRDGSRPKGIEVHEVGREDQPRSAAFTTQEIHEIDGRFCRE